MRKLFSILGKYLKECDLFLLGIAIACSVYGLILISSATLNYENSRYLIVQITAVIVGIIVFIAATLLDFDQISRLWKYLFLANVLLLVSTLFFGVGLSSTGNNSWLRFSLGGFSLGIQPGEIGKILFVITFSKHITMLENKLNKLYGVLSLCMHFGVFAILILFCSKDDGMVISYFFIFLIMLLVAGVKLRYFAIGGGVAAIGAPILWFFIMADYQKNRILAVLDPTYGLNDAGYHAFQSKVAIAGGGIWGQGLFKGLQTQFGSLPAKHTDFIFSVAAEELGFAGAMLIIILLSVIIFKCFHASFMLGSRSLNGLICTGVGAMFFFQTFTNIGMCLGIVPVIGLTLPFFSYGGSSIVTMFLALGLVASSERFGARPADHNALPGTYIM